MGLGTWLVSKESVVKVLLVAVLSGPFSLNDYIISC